MALARLLALTRLLARLCALRRTFLLARFPVLLWTGLLGAHAALHLFAQILGLRQRLFERLLVLIAGARLIRFTIIGFLAVWLGTYILTLAKTPEFEYAMVGFILLCVVGSAFSIYSWVYRSRRK